MSLFHGPAWINNGKITCSQIEKSSIDMHGEVIRSVGTPQLPSDGANKDYVDRQFSNQTLIVNVTLTSTNPVTLIDWMRYGTFRIAVMGADEGKPCAIFEVCKSSFDRADISRAVICDNAISSVDESEPSTRIELSWDQNDFIKIYKTSHNCDGNYIVRIN